jgi:hypothetical protein
MTTYKGFIVETAETNFFIRFLLHHRPFNSFLGSATKDGTIGNVHKCSSTQFVMLEKNADAQPLPFPGMGNCRNDFCHFFANS